MVRFGISLWGLLLAGTLLAQEAPPARLAMTATPISPVLTRGEVPLCVAVQIRNPNARFQGSLEAFFREDATGKVRHFWNQVVDVGVGEFLYHLYPQVPPGGIAGKVVVHLLDAKRQTVEEWDYPIRFEMERNACLAVTVPQRRFDLEQLQVEPVKVTRRSRFEVLPDQWYGYLPFDLVCWDTQIVADLPAVKKRALQDWVRAGGRLLLVSKPGDPLGRSPFGEEIRPDGEAVQTRVVGEGRVVVFSSISSFRRMAHTERNGLFPKSETRAGAVSRRINPSQGFAGPVAPLAQMGAFLGYRQLDFKPVFRVMILYILVVSVVDYLVLKRLRRLPWTWLTFPLAIAAFSFHVYRSFYQQVDAKRPQCEFVRKVVGPDGSVRVNTLLGFRKNTTKPTQLSVPPDEFLCREFQNDYEWSFDAGRSIREVAGPKGRLNATIDGPVGSFQFVRKHRVEQNSFPRIEGHFDLGSEEEVSGRIDVQLNKQLVYGYLTHEYEVYQLFADSSFQEDGVMRFSVSPESKGIVHVADFNHLAVEKEILKNQYLTALVEERKWRVERRDLRPFPDSVYPEPISADEVTVVIFYMEEEETRRKHIRRVISFSQTFPLEGLAAQEGDDA